jgi:hypothetical protein
MSYTGSDKESLLGKLPTGLDEAQVVSAIDPANFFDYEKIKPPEPEIPDAPLIEVPKIEIIGFTFDEIKAKTDGELNKILSGEAYPEKQLSSSTITLINAELTSRAINRASKTRWTTIISIIVGIISMVLGGIAVWPDIELWRIQPVQPASITHDVPSFRQSHLPTDIPPQPPSLQQPSSKNLSLENDRPVASIIQPQPKPKQQQDQRKQHTKN